MSGRRFRWWMRNKLSECAYFVQTTTSLYEYRIHSANNIHFARSLKPCFLLHTSDTTQQAVVACSTGLPHEVMQNKTNYILAICTNSSCVCVCVCGGGGVAWHSGLLWCSTIPSLISKGRVVKKILSGQGPHTQKDRRTHDSCTHP